ncbi:hypothetical protein SEA_KAHLID_128 [Mycobacterium phage Kahlid]|nr:hypothetical protein SEA_WILDER_129 [Mycobacterium phage Wilder]AYD84481.1 hypothetical protein SEA_LILDESTINE_125 [Mycobacterium phage LilDestine]QGJ96424.1 hypothetical protein SEA_KAHLID_128 [Mycobacterium phage Kahlid]
MVDCVDHNHTDELGACEGVVSLYASLSGSGESYPRCERPPDWFDPTYAGERWNEDD